MTFQFRNLDWSRNFSKMHSQKSNNTIKHDLIALALTICITLICLLPDSVACLSIDEQTISSRNSQVTKQTLNPTSPDDNTIQPQAIEATTINPTSDYKRPTYK